MRRGPRPKPRELRLVEGNPAKRRLPPPDPSTKPLGNPPKGLSADERATWRRVKRECPWIKRADRMIVEAYCRAWNQMVVADEALLLAVERGGDEAKMRPLQRMLDGARSACLRMMVEIGATATSRARVKGFGEGRPSDPTDRYFERSA